MEGTQSAEQNWLERMHTFLSWKVVGFDFNNPFARPVSDPVLKDLSNDLEALRKMVRVRGSMDGEEILTLKNLKELTPQTNHPSLSKFKKGDIEKYLDSCNVRPELERQLLGVQKECREELERRQQKKAQ